MKLCLHSILYKIQKKNPKNPTSNNGGGLMAITGKWRGLAVPKLPLGATHVAYLICGGSKGLGGLPVAQSHAKQALERTCSNHTHQ